MAHEDAEEISHLVIAVFRAWRQAGIDFLVLRNYDGLPDYISNDIDVLVRPAERARTEQTLLAAAREAGFRLHNRAEFATLALYLSSRHSTAQVHFDLFTDLKWRGFDFLDCSDFPAQKVEHGLFAAPHPAHEAATNLLASMIFTGRVKDKYRAAIATVFSAHAAIASALLAKTYGKPHADFVTAAAARQSWDEIEMRTARLRRAAICRQLVRQPWRVLRTFSKDLRRLAGRWFRPPGLTLVLCGADGSGKSTAAPLVQDGMSRTFSPQKSRHYHWKPPLFSARRSAARPPVADPHRDPSRGAMASLIFFALHWVEFFAGHWLRVQPVRFRGGLVLIDRYYYDFFVDQRRYRLRVPRWLVWIGYRLLPKPDLLLVLDAPAEILQQRKQEVAPLETERQRNSYLELAKRFGNARIIDTSQPPAKAAEDMERIVLEFMATRAGTRWS